MYDQTRTWEKYQVAFFWLELCSYCIMIAEMLFVLAVFLNRRGRHGSCFSCSAAVFGFLINVMCLFLFLFAEAKRCCKDNNPDTNIFTRILGSDSSNEYDSSVTEYINCCPKFGSRMHGGLGNIEPFTALIALAPMRFFVASLIAKFIGNGSSETEDLPQSAELWDQDHEPDPAMKARELWMTAIGAHSDVAQKYGLFSGELLQCMLGIYSDGNNDGSNESEASVRGDDSSGIIDIVSDREASQRAKKPCDTTSMSLTRTPKPPMSSRQLFGNDEGWFDNFAYPKARLIRRMRRCERRLLPLFDEWMVVDVVLTSHELVLFDVLDETERSGLNRASATIHLTNGGKGSYLCDVAKGRKIVSQFNLDDINFVDIEHRTAISQENIDGEDVEWNRNHSLLEYWQRGNHTREDYDINTLTNRWNHVDEDRLKIQFKHHSLVLRFMADLKEMEEKRKNPPGDAVLMNNIGTQTKVWCRTIARYVGS